MRHDFLWILLAVLYVACWVSFGPATFRPRWLFMHNGYINEFATIKRDLVLAVDPSLYAHIQGQADTEVLFFLALTPPFGAARRPASCDASSARGLFISPDTKDSHLRALRQARREFGADASASPASTAARAGF